MIIRTRLELPPSPALWIRLVLVSVSTTTHGIFNPVRSSTTFDNATSLSNLDVESMGRMALFFPGSKLPLFVEKRKDSAKTDGGLVMLFTSCV